MGRDILTDSKVVGETIEHMEDESGATAQVLQRGDEVHGRPDVSTEIREGDRVVFLGTQEHREAFEELS